MNNFLPETPVIWMRYPSLVSGSTGGYGFGQGGFGQGGFGGNPGTQSGTSQPLWVPWTID